MVARGKGLEGRAVVVTRDESANGPLTSELESRGARVLLWPTVRITAPLDPVPLQSARENLADFDWVVFTSARAVTAVGSVEETLELGELRDEWQGRVDTGGATPASIRLPETLRVAAVGAGTARACQSAGWPVHLEPEEHSSVALVRAFGELGMEGRRVLFPASSLAGRSLVRGLTELGAEVAEVVAYRTETVPLSGEARAAIGRMLSGVDGVAGEVDAISFASPSAVRAWEDILPAEEFTALGRRLVVAAIGSTTAAALRNAGCLDLAVAGESTFAGLADVLEESFTHAAGR